MTESTHIEADNRVILHVIHALKKSYSVITVRCNDSDIVILLIGYMQLFRDIAPFNHSFQLMTLCGSGSTTVTTETAAARATAPKSKGKKEIQVKYHLSIKSLEQQLGADRSKGLMLLHAFSGCDYVESFFSVEKATWIEAYKNDDRIPHIFAGLTTGLGILPELEEQDIDDIASFVLKAYKRDAAGANLAEARLDCLVSVAHVDFRKFPPSRAALVEHIKRSLYVAGWVWGRAFQAKPALPSPAGWGWTESDTGLLTAIYTSKISEHDKLVGELLKSCTCRTLCLLTGNLKCNNCSCSRNAKACYGKCACRGDCCKENCCS